jgi:hypothetical protein
MIWNELIHFPETGLPGSLYKDMAITFRFEIRANDSTFFNFEVCRNYLPYTALYRSTDYQTGIKIGKEKSSFQFEMNPYESDANFKFGLLPGNLDAGDTIWIDNVRLREIEDTNQYEPEEWLRSAFATLKEDSFTGIPFMGILKFNSSIHWHRALITSLADPASYSTHPCLWFPADKLFRCTP